jgi:hypothetical protein
MKKVGSQRKEIIYLAKLVCNSTLVTFKEMKHHKEAECAK